MPIPWLAPQVIEHLESLLRPEFEVIEHGSGGSTLWFAERVTHVTAFEQNDDWARMVKKEAPGNVTVESKREHPYGTVIPQNAFDLFLIDGEPVEDRAKWLTAAPSLVKPGGWVVLDNANRPEYAAERKALQELCESFETFDCNEKTDGGSTKYLVTDFYKLKGAQEPVKSQMAREATRKTRRKAAKE